MMENTPLSPSRVKTLKECSWIYYCKYKLNLPEAKNSGSSMGTICHLLFEVLGNPRHLGIYNKVAKCKSIYDIESVRRLVHKHARRLGVFSGEYLAKMDEMICMGVRYDFFGKSLGKNVNVLSEKGFDFQRSDGDINYRIKGFIDKLFLVKEKSSIVIRDYKSSKKMFEGQDIEFNLQDYMYTLAIKHLYPDFVKRQMEFVFLQFGNQGIQAMPELTEDQLVGLELYLTEIQKVINAFDEKSAVQNFAYDQGFPKDNSFSGKLKCGRNMSPKQLKKDGSVMWGCPFKWPFDYYEIWTADGELINTVFENEHESAKLIYPYHKFIKKHYSGCPKWS